LILLNGRFHSWCDLDLEGIVAKRLGDVYGTNRDYSQKKGRAELSERRSSG
jgi:hypothetical protein